MPRPHGKLIEDAARGERGFTLIEVMVVIAIAAVLAKLVTANLGALVPSTLLDAEAAKIMTRIEYMRSEAQLQGKSYTFEFDLERNRWRIVMPPEERLVSTQTVGESIPMVWEYLDERVKFGGFHSFGNFTARSSVSSLRIDENGYTTDAMIYLRMIAENLEYNVWTVRVFGLEPRAELLTNVDGIEPRLPIVDEASFR